MTVPFRNNLIKLVLIHILLLAYPLMSKMAHVHHGEQVHYKFFGNTSFNQTEVFCPVCDFEFYSFIATQPLSAIIYLKSIPVFNSPSPQIHFVQVISYFPLRGPPVA